MSQFSDGASASGSMFVYFFDIVVYFCILVYFHVFIIFYILYVLMLSGHGCCLVVFCPEIIFIDN